MESLGFPVRRTKSSLVPLALLLICAFFLSGCSPVADSKSAGTNSYVQDEEPDGFYRLMLDVRVKDTSEIVKIDYVASCGAIVQRSDFTTSSVLYGMAPHIMLAPTRSGELIGIRTPEVCDASDWWSRRDGEKIVENPPSDFLPLIMWYPDAKNIDFAIGYLSDKAYESPYAKIEILSSSIAKSNLEEWRAWRKTAEETFEPIGALPGPWGHQMIGRPGSSEKEQEYLRTLNEGKPVLMDLCYSAGLVDLPEEGRNRILNMLPDKTRAWTSAWDLEQEQVPVLYDALDELDFEGTSFLSHQGRVRELGVRRSTGGGAFVVGGEEGIKGRSYHDVYPIVPYQREAPDPESEYVAIWRFEMLTDPEWNGFGICGNRSPSPQALTEYSAGRVDRLVFDNPYEPPMSGGPEASPALEIVMRQGEVIYSQEIRTGYGRFRGGYVAVIVGRSGQIIPDCCIR